PLRRPRSKSSTQRLAPSRALPDGISSKRTSYAPILSITTCREPSSLELRNSFAQDSVTRVAIIFVCVEGRLCTRIGPTIGRLLIVEARTDSCESAPTHC